MTKYHFTNIDRVHIYATIEQGEIMDRYAIFLLIHTKQFIRQLIST